MTDLFDKESGFFKTYQESTVKKEVPKRGRRPVLFSVLIVLYLVTLSMLAQATGAMRVPGFDYAAPVVALFLVLVAIVVVIFDL